MGKILARNVQLKRAYEPSAAGDGTRILVDRLWPRGVKKADAAIDHWAKELSPSTRLRKWFGHDPARWQEFADATPQRRTSISMSSKRFVTWRGKARSRSYSLLMTRLTMTPSHCGMFSWGGGTTEG